MDKEDSPTSDTAYTNLIQSMNRFMLDTTSSESIESGIVSGTSTPGDRGHEASRRGLPLNQGGKAMMGWNPNVTDVLAGGGTSAESPQTAAAVAARRNPEGTDSRSLISRLFANGAVTKTTCGTCGNETTRESSSHVIDLVYPRKALSNEPATASDFASILRSSLVRETLSKATCRACHTPASPLRSRRVLPPNSRLPQALSVNAAVHTSEQLGYWLDGVSAPDSEHTRTYVPPKLGIDVQGEEVRSKGIWNDEEMTSFKGAAVYTLRVSGFLGCFSEHCQRSSVLALT